MALPSFRDANPYLIGIVSVAVIGVSVPTAKAAARSTSSRTPTT